MLPKLHDCYDGIQIKGSGLMDYVYEAASKSMDPRTKIGSVISFPEWGRTKNVEAANRTLCGGGLEEYLTHMTKHEALEHAERLAIHDARVRLTDASKHGLEIRLAVNEIPCADCARAISLAKITDVYICFWWQMHVTTNGPDPSRKIAAAREIFRRNNVNLFIDATGSLIDARRDDFDFVPHSRHFSCS